MDISPIRVLDTATGPAQPASQASANRELVKAVNAVNSNQSLGDNNELVFLMDRVTHRAIMRVVDKVTKEVVMEVPPDYVLRLAREAQKPSSILDEIF